MLRKLTIAALALAVATPAFAGGWCRHPGSCAYGAGYGPGAYYGQRPNGSWGYIDGYGYGHAGGELAPPPKPPVAVTPSHCHRPIFDTQSQKWRCAPVLVPQWNGNGGY